MEPRQQAVCESTNFPSSVLLFVGKIRDCAGEGLPEIYYVLENGGINSPSSYTRAVDYGFHAHSSGSVASNCRGPHQIPLVCPWGFLPRFFDHETTKPPITNTFTPFHKFPTLKSYSNWLRHASTSLNQLPHVTDVFGHSGS